MGRGLYSLVDWNSYPMITPPAARGRGLYSLVDWNASSWESFPDSALSRLIQPRGLKYEERVFDTAAFDVEAYTASWIEMLVISIMSVVVLSRLIQPRGLKYEHDFNGTWKYSRGLYSLVDWNKHSAFSSLVEARRGLYSLVDWNSILFLFFSYTDVEAYTASWIEILQCCA